MSPKAIAQVVPGVAAQSESAARILRSQEEAEAYVASVCFKHGPPRLLGVELEWLLGNRSRPADPLDTQVLRTALGPYTPTSLDPRSAPATLPAGSQVTVEPGGQVELASKPQADLQSLVGAVQADSALLHTRLAEQGLYPHQAAADPLRPPRRILRTARYTAMEAAFDRLGTVGRSMMCSTAAVQPSVDLGERADLALRWQAVHLLGPVLVAAFANSPLLHGRRTGWKSSRMSVWLALDPPRTAPPELSDTDPAAGYARRVMQAEVICLRRSEESWLAPPGIRFADWFSGALPGLPSTADLDLHLSTMFPPVRPHGHVEVRYIDAQPGDEWVAPVAVLAALLSDRAVTSAAVDACLPVAGQWVVGARDGLADPAIARAAIRVFELAVQALPGLIGPGPVRRLVEEVVLRRVLRGRCPADADHNHTDNNHTAYDDARGGTR